MASTVMYNEGAQLSLGQLNKNITKAGKALARVSSGMRIVGAQDDDSASFAISEKMREQIRSLLQDNQNVQNGSSMIKVAERGIDQIVRLLDNMKQLAINAANDSNTDEDRRTIQKEFDSRMATINDIAIGTEYNGQRLLDGTWSHGKETIVPEIEDGEDDGEDVDPTNPPPLPAGYPFAKDVAEADPNYQVQITNLSNQPITQGGVYQIDPNFTGTITVNTTEPVKFVPYNSSQFLNNVQIQAGGNANIWIEGLKITNTQDMSAFKFSGTGNVLTVEGSNTFNSSGANTAVINVGGGLNVQGTGSISLTLPSNSKGAGIGSDMGEKSNADILISGVSLTANVYDGAAVGSGGYGGSIGNIIVEDATLNVKGHYNANIGSGANNASAGNITVVHSNITSNNVDTGIGSGFPKCTCGDIDIYNSTMNISNTHSACIGSGDTSKCGDIYVSNSDITGKSTNGACIGTGQNSATSGNITVVNGTKVKHTSPNGAAIGSGLTGNVTGKISYSDSVKIDASGCYVDSTHEDHPGIGRGRNGYAPVGAVEKEDDDTEYHPPTWKTIRTGENPLWIQHGTQSGQRIHVYINSMQTKALRGTIPNEFDEAQLAALDFDKRKQAELHAILDAAKDMTLDDAKVTTVDNAKVAIRVVEGALEYALNEATTQGAYLRRLEFTDSNVTIMGENVTQAESTIRDADMAKEMTEYTKYNILTQSSQAMLAQANRNGASVLSLLA